MRVPWAAALVGVTPGHPPFLQTLRTSSKILNVQQRGYQPRAGHIQPVKEAMIHVFLCSCIVLTSLCCFVHTRRFGLLLHTGMGTVRKPQFFRQSVADQAGYPLDLCCACQDASARIGSGTPSVTRSHASNWCGAPRSKAAERQLFRNRSGQAEEVQTTLQGLCFVVCM